MCNLAQNDNSKGVRKRRTESHNLAFLAVFPFAGLHFQCDPSGFRESFIDTTVLHCRAFCRCISIDMNGPLISRREATYPSISARVSFSQPLIPAGKRASAASARLIYPLLPYLRAADRISGQQGRARLQDSFRGFLQPTSIPRFPRSRGSRPEVVLNFTGTQG